MTLESTDSVSKDELPFRDPYPGLRPFLQKDAPRFFGRGRQINAMLQRLEDQRFLAVVGASGCGKSSLVYAGLLPALVNGYLMDALPNWRMVKLRPGNSPLGNLARALHDSLRSTSTTDEDLVGVSLTLNTLRSGRLGLLEAIHDAQVPDDANILVLVDQFEEIFRYREKEELSQAGETKSQSKYERQNESIAFVNLLLTAAAEALRPVYVILTMRSDFLGDCDQFQGLPEAINRSQFLAPRMTRDQLREAIVGPLKLFHEEAEPGLVDRILNEIGTDPDQLPLMQHALMRTWSIGQLRTADGTQKLTVENYENRQVGGVAKALDRHAEDIYLHWSESPPDAKKSLNLGGTAEPLPSARQRICERMFRCLSDTNQRGRVVRRLATIQEIADVAGVAVGEVITVAEPFLADDCSFLTASPKDVLTPETTLDISHEALLRQWGRLRGWIKTERQSADTYHRLARQTYLYRRKQASIWRRDDIVPVERWFEREQPTAAWAIRYSDSEREEASFDDSRLFLNVSRGREAFWTNLKSGLLVACVVFIVFGFYVWWSIDQARQAAELKKAIENKKAAERKLAEETLQKEKAQSILKAVSATQRIRPIRPGIGIGNAQSVGSICCIVKHRATGIRCLLASDSLGSRVGDPIWQPYLGSDADRVAELISWTTHDNPSVRGAVARLLPQSNGEKRILVNGKEVIEEPTNVVQGIGPIEGIARVEIDAEPILVQKVGMQSGLTTGVARKLNTPVDFLNTQITGMIMISSTTNQPFSLGGDGGAPVLTQDRKLIGMLYGGSDGTVSFAIPIEKIFETFQVDLDMTRSPLSTDP